jgi:hypothetical protein
LWCGRWKADRKSRDDGAGTVEYVGLLFLIAAIVFALGTVALPDKVTKGASSAICSIFGGDNCGRTSTNGKSGQDGRSNSGTDGDSSAAGNSPAAGNDDKGNPGWNGSYSGNPANQAWQAFSDQVDGFLGGAWDGTKQAVSGLAGAAWDDVKGFGSLFTHPMNAVKGLGHVITHPVDTVEQLVWDDGSRQAWHDHQYTKAISRGVWNVGSWFIPGYDLGKFGSKIEKLGKVADEAGKLGKVAKAAEKAEKAAQEAERAAKSGDVERAEKAAAEARKDAEEAEKEARKNGCKLVGLGPFSLDHAVSSGRFGALLSLPAQGGGDACKNASDAAAARDRAVRAAERAQLEKDVNAAVKAGRFEDADNLLDKADANAAAARDAARKDPSPGNKDAANEAERFAERQRQKVIDSKLNVARRSVKASERQEAEVADAVRPALRNFQRKYGPNGKLGEVDVETNKAIVEVAGGVKMHKTNQIAKYINDRTINPSGKPVIVFAPQMTANAVREAEKAGAIVVRNTAELKQKLRDLGENIP